MQDRRSRLLLASFLKRERESAGLKQAELAERLGVPQSFISKCEGAERRVDLVDILAICRALGISVSDFVDNFQAQLEREE